MVLMQNFIALPLAHTATRRHLIGAFATDRVLPDRRRTRTR
jgi:hypothetical protein